MATIPAGLGQVTHSGQNGGQPWYVVQHVLVSPWTPGTYADANLFAEAMRSAFAARFLPLLTDQLTYDTCEVEISNGDGTFLPGIASNLVIGSIGGGYLDAASAFLLSWRHASTWIGGQPRSYIPGIPSAQMQNPAVLNATDQAAMQSAAAAYLADVNAVTLPGGETTSLGAERRRSGGLPLDPTVFVPFVGVICRPTPGTQRRRLR